MSTNSPRPQDSSILGESWVVASSSPDKEDRPPESPRHSRRLHKKDGHNGCSSGTNSMTTSASSVSGPELIMPSIHEAPISEGSWVAPSVRSKSLRRRHKSSQENAARKKKHRVNVSRHRDSPGQGLTASHIDADSTRPRLGSRTKVVETFIRIIINVVLTVAISHLLVVPEVVQQYQTLCTIDAVSTLYPASCIPPYPKPQPIGHRATRSDTVASSHARLESLFNTTLRVITPLSSTLKRSESKLRDVETELKKTYPGTKHELDLEFNGCWEATRAATRRFDSLQADMRSAVDNLIATGGIRAGDDSQSAAQDARLSTQMSWREQYLDQLTARMQGKADALSNDLATLDDHLESIGSILAREMKQSSASPGVESALESPGSGVRALADKLPAFLRRAKGRDESVRSDLPISELFQDAAKQHRPVVDAVRQLSSGLQTLQTKTY